MTSPARRTSLRRLMVGLIAALLTTVATSSAADAPAQSNRRSISTEQRWRVEAGGMLPIWALPDTLGYGFFAAFGFQYTRDFEIDVAFIGLLPSARDAGEGRIAANSLLGRINLCGRASGFVFCGVVSSGATIGGGRGYPTDRRGVAFQLGGGAQIAYDFEFAEGFGLRLAIAGEGMLVRARLKIDDETLWTMPPARLEVAASHWVSW